MPLPTPAAADANKPAAMDTDKKPEVSDAAAAAPAPAAAATPAADVQKPAAAATVAGESKVKPLVTKADGAAAASAAPAAPAAEKKARVFFGNSSYYVFFRLFQILYERMHRAHQLARATLNKYAPPPKKDPTTGQPEKPIEPKAKFAAFIKTLYQFVAGTMDQQKVCVRVCMRVCVCVFVCGVCAL